MTEKQITDQINLNLEKIEALKNRNIQLNSLISNYKRTATEWHNQARAVTGNTVKKNNDRAYKTKMGDENLRLANECEKELSLNLGQISKYEADNATLSDMRKEVVQTSKEVSLILANQGLTKAGEEAKAEATAEAIKNEAQTVATARAEAISKEGEANAESKKVQGWIFAAAGGVVLIILSIVLIKKFKKK